jgi:hypothetical protein
LDNLSTLAKPKNGKEYYREKEKDKFYHIHHFRKY